MDPTFELVHNYNRKKRSLGRPAFESQTPNETVTKTQTDPKKNSVTATSATEVKETPQGTIITETVVKPSVKPYKSTETNQIINRRSEQLINNTLSKPDSKYIETDISKYGNLPNITPEYLKSLAEAYRQNEIRNIQEGADNAKTLNNIANKLENDISLLDNVLKPFNSPKNIEALPNALEEKLKVLEKLQQAW